VVKNLLIMVAKDVLNVTIFIRNILLLVINITDGKVELPV